LEISRKIWDLSENFWWKRNLFEVWKVVSIFLKKCGKLTAFLRNRNGSLVPDRENVAQ
jgi:hypothetical protein